MSVNPRPKRAGARHLTVRCLIPLTMAWGALLSHQSSAQANTFFYGIDNNNNIYEVNPLTKTNSLVNATGLTNNQGSNGIAYDTGRDQLFFFYTPASSPYNLQFWNRRSTGPGSLQTITAPSLGSTSIPANAAYYNNSLWYFDGSTSSTNLYQLTFTYNANQDAIYNSLTTYNLASYAGTTYPGGGYGDIAINTTTGFLYGSTTDGSYYKINLGLLGDTSNAVYTNLGTINTLNASGTGYVTSGLQLSFNADYTKLYGTRFCNASSNCSGYVSTAQAGDGLYFEIANYDSAATRNLSASELLYFSSPGFRDLGGATADPVIDVPGPLPLLGAAGAFGWSRRIRRRLRASRRTLHAS